MEFALILPPLALIFTAILQFGVLFSAQIGITNAVREAVREASAIPVSANTSPSYAAQNAAQAVYARLTSATGLLVANGSSFNVGAIVTGSGQPSSSPHTSVCYYSYLDATGTYSVMARVEVQYKHPLFIPLVSGIIDGLDGISDNALRVGASEEIRVANAPLTTVGSIGDKTAMVCYP